VKLFQNNRSSTKRNKSDMKAKSILTGILVFVMFNLTFIVRGQNCTNKEFSDLDLGDFDYQSQPSFAKLSPGDTARVKS
jgi:hypothetical protein